ncbi:MAG: bifunctional tRNA (5-methylaminomethyl-2-thiouridine)(34)-methyltransferase MnmD/FAD-dependent 5-carboxymethylaminomethyl-2-thiouridine(34) oxidoreductase MnmC [Marinospirillum sp.]|uniref:bifunctional tRNA (5-methylaminomethyl-2-thiouridine)(34)-methyltransferase MnmD/FAD-dependent 5-carboxymethylaminomethyl-2-thiouridine(34) oxidoreductase MnmC n=1 Tax=Marinospirillum sp. TaxID=2183934 RepID=UPI0019F7D5FD|nr:bifunctional tRNA (5-methylaminomethyl-2-thiouridine)(34)-methyltransferase MnmD/FAD-dependent 5-carboxymethylaminomethyl-2-thiouridine(34) oxidoreductase MnmC [Marinospirillum sp.]MBE0507229.1 bifunctional tRNA (5-methylaminomethyl-2-thiouridine)(34)-methyltransferase MnmD/FAD-dependent 5-carboxymethylaminomethyl-2-thiouridine(34) oxidoreductase MnmC [Marinospirillum sp.]
MPETSSSVIYSHLHPRALQTAQIQWQEGTPVADAFDDVYFSRNQGPDESRYVFLQQNNLPERWQSWQQQRAFVVGETGFGSGLNLLVAIQAFLQTAPSDARLHWISTELFPLTPEDLQQAHNNWPELGTFSSWLQQNYPQAVSGFHRLHLHPRITLDLLLGDAASNLAALDAQVDAWCLDGFAPLKNPGMWTDQLFAALAHCSHADTTFATFTSVGNVKRSLRAAGFTVKKVQGFGSKWDMLRGGFTAPNLPHTKPGWVQQAPQSDPGRIAIIGAGLAGLCTAQALSRRGLEVDLYEADEAGTGGSGNRQGVLYIKLAVDTNPASRFYLSGLEYSRRWLQQTDPEQNFWSPSGVLQLALDEKEQQRQQRFLQRQLLPSSLVYPVDANTASQLADTPITCGGLFYPRAGWVQPGRLCQQLATSLPGIRLHKQQAVTGITQQPQGGWQVTTAQGQQDYDTVILASAFATRKFEPCRWLPIKSIRGQVTHLPLNEKTAPRPRTVVCGTGYVSPPLQQTLCFGATFNLHSNNPQLTDEDHQANIEELNTSLPELLTQLLPQSTEQQAINATNCTGRVGFRCTSPDYLPLVGPAPVAERWQVLYQDLSYNAQLSDLPAAENYPGLWLNIGHGSRGLASIPLASELLVSQLLNEPAPVAKELLESLHPGRFIIRELKRKKLSRADASAKSN